MKTPFFRVKGPLKKQTIKLLTYGAILVLLGFIEGDTADDGHHLRYNFDL